MSDTGTPLDQPIALAPMREQVLAWSAINSGTANLDGLAAMASASPDPVRA